MPERFGMRLGDQLISVNLFMQCFLLILFNEMVFVDLALGYLLGDWVTDQ